VWKLVEDDFDNLDAEPYFDDEPVPELWVFGK